MFSWKQVQMKGITETSYEEIDRYYNISRANDNKRKIISVLLIIQVLSLGIIWKLTSSINIKTYIIEKNGNDYATLGEINKLASKQEKPSNLAIEYFMNNFIKKTRFLSSDIILFKKNYDEIKYFMSNKTLKKNEEYLLESGYKEKIFNNWTVDVIIQSTLQVTKNTYQIRWIEKTYNQIGEAIDEKLMVGIYKIEFKEHRNEQSLLYNPLGLIIVDMSQTIEKQQREKNEK